MPLIKPRPVGYVFTRKPVKLPPETPSSLQVVLRAIRRRLADGPVGRFVRFAVERNPYIVGEHGPRCQIHPTAHVGSAILNATSGAISIGEYAFLSHGVSLLAGTHDVTKSGAERQRAIPRSGYEIVIGRGVWVATNATVIGPCHIGENAVVAAGAVVMTDVPANAVVAGIPARIVKMLDFSPVVAESV